MRIDFSSENYTMNVFVDEEPLILDVYKENAILIDETDITSEGVLIYIIVSKSYLKPDYVIIAFRTEPLNYTGFNPAIFFENSTHTLYIGAGKRIKTYALKSPRLVFEKDTSLGFWGWTKIGNYIGPL